MPRSWPPRPLSTSLLKLRRRSRTTTGRILAE
jgi:hypothetical protein